MKRDRGQLITEFENLQNLLWPSKDLVQKPAKI